MSLHDEIKAKARKALEGFIRSGMSSKEALKKVQNQYVDDVVGVMATGINELKVGTITPTKLKKMAVGGIDLSTNLYRHVDDVNANVLRTVNEHAKELQSAQKLALKIYEGYDFQKDLIDVKKALPKYLFDPLKQMSAKQLKTPALKAAYLKTLNANNEQQLKKALEVAMYERNRYFANRIAQTELHRIQTAAKVQGIMEDDGIEVIQIRLSASHPKVDICDYHANLDAYGLGKGCYPKDKAPLPPYHPFCRCMSAPRIDISLKDAKAVKGNPEKSLMRQFDEDEQASILGTKGMRERWLSGSNSVIELTNLSKKPIYQTKYSDSLGAAILPDVNGVELLSNVAVTDDLIQNVQTVDEAIEYGYQIRKQIEESAPLVFKDGMSSIDKFEAVQAWRKELLKQLDEVIGTSTPISNLSPSSAQAKKAIVRASTRYPDAWTAEVDKVTTHVKFSSKRGFFYTINQSFQNGVKFQKVGTVKGKIDSGDYLIVTDATSTAEHEFGHAIQAALPGLDKIFQDLHKKRTTGDLLERLRDIEHSGYGANEVTRKDGYYKSYQGREYTAGGALEVLTMSFEPILGGSAKNIDQYKLDQNLINFFTKDEELFTMSIGLLFGWKP